MDEARQPLSRKLPIASEKINPYRLVIILRLITIGFFFHYRLLNPVENAYALWLTSVISEICFAVSWVLDQFPKWHPIERETFLDRLSLRYEKGERSQLADIDVFISTVEPKKEQPLATANAVLSVLAVDYPADKVSCYVSDDGAAMLTFEALSETSLFAKQWVPFCRKRCRDVFHSSFRQSREEIRPLACLCSFYTQQAYKLAAKMHLSVDEEIGAPNSFNGRWLLRCSAISEDVERRRSEMSLL